MGGGVAGGFLEEDDGISSPHAPSMSNTCGPPDFKEGADTITPSAVFRKDSSSFVGVEGGGEWKGTLDTMGVREGSFLGTSGVRGACSPNAPTRPGTTTLPGIGPFPRVAPILGSTSSTPASRPASKNTSGPSSPRAGTTASTSTTAQQDSPQMVRMASSNSSLKLEFPQVPPPALNNINNNAVQSRQPPLPLPPPQQMSPITPMSMLPPLPLSPTTTITSGLPSFTSAAVNTTAGSTGTSVVVADSHQGQSSSKRATRNTSVFVTGDTYNPISLSDMSTTAAPTPSTFGHGRHGLNIIHPLSQSAHSSSSTNQQQCGSYIQNQNGGGGVQRSNRHVFCYKTLSAHDHEGILRQFESHQDLSTTLFLDASTSRTLILNILRCYNKLYDYWSVLRVWQAANMRPASSTITLQHSTNNYNLAVDHPSPSESLVSSDTRHSYHDISSTRTTPATTTNPVTNGSASNSANELLARPTEDAFTGFSPINTSAMTPSNHTNTIKKQHPQPGRYSVLFGHSAVGDDPTNSTIFLASSPSSVGGGGDAASVAATPSSSNRRGNGSVTSIVHAVALLLIRGFGGRFLRGCLEWGPC
jgi:hypothetical protein